MANRRDDGSITVFLAITFVAIMAMLGTLIDGARLVESHSQMFYATDLAAASALAEFDYDLKDRYGLFAYHDDPKITMDWVVKQNINSSANRELSSSENLFNGVLDLLGVDDPTRHTPFDLLQLNNVNVSQFADPICLKDVNEFERQIFEYVKFRGPIELFNNGLSLDFGEMMEEMEKARNEDSVEEAMEEIQKKLGEHHNTEGQYNKDVKKFRENAAKIYVEDYRPILEKLDESPSLGGLETLSGMIGDFSLMLSDIQSDAKKLLVQLETLEETRDQLQNDADSLSGRFTGSGDTAQFDGKAISGEMLDNYKEDIEEMKNQADLYWTNNGQADGVGGSTSTTEAEKQKYVTIIDMVSEAQENIEAFQIHIEELSKRMSELERQKEDGEIDDDEYQTELDAIQAEVEELWSEMDRHFNDVPYENGMNGIFPNTEQLQDLRPYRYQTDEGQKQRSKVWTKKANEMSKKEKENKRSYTKEIPSSYPLHNTITTGQILQGMDLNLDGDFDSQEMDNVINKRSNNKSSTNGVKNLFQSVANFSLDTFDNAMLGLYALGNFQNALCFKTERPSSYSHEEVDLLRYASNMRNDPIEDSTIFFDDCEVEYLIYGKLKETDNYQSVRNELTGIYFTLNYAFARKTNAIRKVVESIANAVRAGITGATLGLGAGAGTIAYYATREACYAAIAGVQTCHDLERLYYGNKVPLLKKGDKDYCGLADLLNSSEISGRVCHDNAKTSQIPISYTDYLFIRMILVGQNQLRGRLQDLVELNMNTKGGSLNTDRPFKLENSKTSVSVKAEAAMPFFFINVIFTAENLNGRGMKVTKYASQRY